MGFLAISKERLRLSRMRRELEAEPRAQGIVELARAYLGLGDEASAAEVIGLGLQRFPESDELARLRLHADAGRSEQRLRAAKELVRARPCAQSSLMLADAYRALGRMDQCAATLRDLLERFGPNGTALAQLGEIRYRRFLANLAMADGQAAESLLSRAIESDPEALKPRYLLAELYCRIGAAVRCRSLLTRLMAVAPEHERGKDLLRFAGERAPAPAAGAGDEDVFTLLGEVEERMSLAVERLPWEADGGAGGGAGELPRSSGRYTPEVELQRLIASTGAARAVFTDGKGAESSAPDAAPLAAVARDLAGVFQRAARGMELGAPVRLFIDGTAGHLVLEFTRDSMCALQLPASANAEHAAALARGSLDRLDSNP